MPRGIKVGDRVQAFLNASILGEVVEIIQAETKIWTSGGAPSATFSTCRVKISKTGEIVTVKKSDLFIVEY